MAWFNAGLSSNSGGASSFNELDDVAINTQTLSNGQVPVYNSTTHKWENGEQSGGSSGHTIIDDGGTSLTQRDNLQFKGAYSEDNSTNGKTVVNVVRSMTKAQFDQLTNNEKTGFINITDITGGNDDRFQPVIYSTDEREIGVWTDGKPLYQKSIPFNNTSTESLNVDVSSLNIDICIDISAYVNASSYDAGNYYSTSSDLLNAYFHRNNNVIVVRRGSTSAKGSGYVTIRYTKTTDTPGSGQWTPQGVPAHHYSTDEQVVGTWIDGSTLYEKTITNIPFPSSKGSLQTDTNIVANMTFIQTAFCSIFGVSNVVRPEGALIDQVGITAHIDSSTNHIILTTRSGWDRSTFSGIATLRYTKSST